MKKLIVALTAAGLLLLAAPFSHLIPASQEAVRPQKPLQHEVSVTLKLIQVIVTDKNGNPVTDLRREDFVLTDNGREMKLTEFERHDLRLPALAEKPGAEVVAATPLPAPRLLNRKFFLFFDFAYNNPAGVRKMGETARHFLDTRVLPTDEIGVVSYSTLKRLQVNLYLTTDHQKVRDLVARIGLRDSNQRFEDLEDKYQRELEAGNLADARPEAKLTKPGPDLPEFDLKELWRLSAVTYIDSLTALAYALRSIPGQKHLVLFSEGIPYPVLYPQKSAISELGRKYENLLKELATSNVSVYALYTGGIKLGDTQTGAWTLAKTSSETGGRYWGNMYNYEPFVDKVQTLTGTYYVLGYPVSEAWDGKYHRIHVTVRRPGLEVRAQWGYFSPKIFTDYTDLEKMIHLVDLALAENPISQTPVRFSMSALACSGGKDQNLCFAAEIPVEKIREISGKKVEVIRLVFSAADDIVELRRTEEDFTKIPLRSAYLLSTLSVPPGVYKCRIVIRNLETGAAAVAASAVVVPEPKENEILLYPPLLLRPERGAYYVKGTPSKVAAGKSASSSPLTGFAFDAGQYAPYVDKILWSGSEAWAAIRCLTPKIAAPEIRLSAFLLDKLTQDKIAVPLTVISRHDEKNAKAYFVRLLVPDVEPDEYMLHFVAEEMRGGSTSGIASDFSVERPKTAIRSPEKY